MSAEDRRDMFLARARKAIDGGEVWTMTARAAIYAANEAALAALGGIS